MITYIWVELLSWESSVEGPQPRLLADRLSFFSALSVDWELVLVKLLLMLIVEPDTVGDDGGFTGVIAWGSISLSFFIWCITPVNDILALIKYFYLLSYH